MGLSDGGKPADVVWNGPVLSRGSRQASGSNAILNTLGLRMRIVVQQCLNAVWMLGYAQHSGQPVRHTATHCIFQFVVVLTGH